MPSQLLSPDLMHTVSGLELVAKIIVEGFMSGSNKSQSIGAGQEFSQYRNYEPGDDLRQLDWKMFARSDRYVIKQSEIETNITVKFMLDASHSMAYAEDGISKLQYSKVLIAALGYLARKQSDTIGLYAVNDKNISMMQPRFEQQQFMRFLTELVSIKSESTWSQGSKTELLYHHHGKEMIIFFTDLYDDRQDLQNFIRRLKTRRNEVIVFHLMGKRESDLSHSGTFTFEDLESGHRIQADSLVEQMEYSHRVKEWIKSSRNWMLEKQVFYQVVTLDESPQDVLRNFLSIRKKLIR
jgi:uncharacterized protein (DUF58 family)